MDRLDQKLKLIDKLIFEGLVDEDDKYVFVDRFPETTSPILRLEKGLATYVPLEKEVTLMDGTKRKLSKVFVDRNASAILMQPIKLAEYFGGEIEPLGERFRLNIRNLTGMDLWIEWFRDVHQDYQLDFLRSGEANERKSRKVSVVDGAYFPIKVYKNDNGRKGRFIAEFTDHVAGYTVGYDIVVLGVVNINGTDYFQATSVATVAQIIVQVVLAS